MTRKPDELTAYSNLVESIYDSAIAPDRWTNFLRELAQALNGKSALLRVIDERIPAIRANFHFNLDPELQKAHRQYYVTRDVYLDALKDKPGTYIATGEQMADPCDVRRSEFFNEYLLPQDSHHVCGGLAMRNHDLTVKFGVQRSKNAGPFSQSDADYIRLLVPHIQRATRLSHLLDLARHQCQSAEHALESLSVGIVLLDEHEHLLHANAKADELMRARRGLHLSNGRLSVTQDTDMRRFRDLMGVAHGRVTADAPPIPECMLLTPGPTEPQLLLVACPIKPHQPHFRGPWPEVGVAVFVSNLDDAGLLNDEVLIRLYGLTPSEARLACRLSRGYELTELSAEWHISRETLRTHLKRVLAKTGTARQSELIRLLAGKPWSVGPMVMKTAEST